jgi:dTDP-4-dehydrorhamnose reductase
MIRVAVTGARGQVASALVEKAGPEPEIVALSRPEFALEDRCLVLVGVNSARPDVVINAAAYTAVDRAESEEDLATRVNAEGAGHMAEAAAMTGAPFLHLSTDCVFGGALDRPYREDHPTRPTGAYGRSKLAGERRFAMSCPNSAILRTAWVYSPFGANFVRTMLRLNETREEVDVVADQRGDSTSALVIADALVIIARRIHDDPSPTLRGVFHMSGAGEATWADLAEADFAKAHARGRPLTGVRRIASSEYPTPARRPANSRLDNEKLRRACGVALPDWRASLGPCVARLIS